MRILLMTRYGAKGASSRYRSLQYLAFLEQQGFQVDVHSLMDDEYLTNLYAGRRVNRKRMLRTFLSRALKLSRSRSYDLLWIEKELMPYIPAGIENLLRSHRVPFIVDFDDAIFHGYDQHQSLLVRKLLGGKIKNIVKHSSIVIAGNPYLAESLLKAGAPQVEILPSVVDLEKYKMKDHTDGRSGVPTVGWIGTPMTARYLAIVEDAISDAAQKSPIKVLTIGISNMDVPKMNVAVETTPWSERTEVASLLQVDIGIMPLTDDPWARGKSGLKLIQYMACGLPVIASPVGVNRDIVEHGVNGYLCRTQEEWTDAIVSLSTDRELRSRLGSAGRRKVEEKYSLRSAAPRLASILKSAARRELE